MIRSRTIVSGIIGICALLFFILTPGSSPRDPVFSVPDDLEASEPGCSNPAIVSQTQGQPVLNELLGGNIQPERKVLDPYPTFHGIATDPKNDLVVMSDSNTRSLLIYDRKSGGQSGEVTKPLRQITGPATAMMFIAGVALDPQRQEIFTVCNDIGDLMLVFSYDGHGNIRPKRMLNVPHQSWGLSLNQARDELAVTVERSNMVAIYRREAQKGEAPLRVIRGSSTGMADPHGVYFDEANKEIFVSNHGNKATGRLPAESEDEAPQHTFTETIYIGGHFDLPSITVYPEEAEGDTKSLRNIQGSKTRLNWPMGLDVDPDHNEIAIANSGDSSVLLFGRTDTGDVAPRRVVAGNQTGLNHPMGVAFDRVNDELWVTNYNDHTALVFSRNAEGNVVPKRIIRNAPAGTPTVGFGNPGSIAYDSKRQELLVPN